MLGVEILVNQEWEKLVELTREEISSKGWKKAYKELISFLKYHYGNQWFAYRRALLSPMAISSQRFYDKDEKVFPFLPLTLFQ